MTKRQKKIDDVFPREEEFVDFSGQSRRFLISLQQKVMGGCIVEAQEIADHEGYRFTVFSTGSPFVALGDLRWKIRKRLSTRHIYSEHDGRTSLTHDSIRGHISAGGIVVDGIFLPYDQLINLLTTYEGFSISVKISDPTDVE